MKFKKYVKESVAEKPLNVLDEGMFDADDWNPDRRSLVQDEIDAFYAPVKKLIADKKYDEARKELADLEADLNGLEAANSKKKFFRFPQFMIDGQRKRIEALKAQLPTNESIEDMDKRCEKCNTLLNDQGTCPKCDDGEEDYGDELKEGLSNKEKLKRAFPELNFDTPPTEELAEELTNAQKLKRAYPELNIAIDTAELVEESLDEYDDDYSIDDVEEDRIHAALYGGDRTYCKCGKRLVRTDWGSYCPDCEPETAEEEHLRMVDDEMSI